MTQPARRLVTVVVDVTSDLNQYELADLIRFHLGLGSLTASDVDFSAATIIGGRVVSETPMTAATWCRKCGHPYDADHLPTCECAGDPPADFARSAGARGSSEGRRYLDRVRRLEWIDGGVN